MYFVGCLPFWWTNASLCPGSPRNPAFWWTTLPVQHTCPPQHSFWWTSTHSYLPSSPRSASQSPVVRFAATKAGFGAVFLQRRPPNVSVIGFAVGCAWFSVMLGFRLFFCSEAYVRPSRCASPYSVEYSFSAPLAIPIAIPSPVERESPSRRVSARSTVTELTPLSGKFPIQAPLPAQRYSKSPR